MYRLFSSVGRFSVFLVALVGFTACGSGSGSGETDPDSSASSASAHSESSQSQAASSGPGTSSSSSSAQSSRPNSGSSSEGVSSRSSTSAAPSSGDCVVNGALEQWGKVELLCEGPSASENEEKTFTDYRFNVTFSNGDEERVVPGHFAADGKAADTGASAGNKWRAYFAPPTIGTWTYSVSFRSGSEIAVSDSSGSSVSGIDGANGSFTVGSNQDDGKNMRRRGLLSHHDGERYLRFSDNSVFIQGGMNSPENIFGYSEFDNTTKYDNAESCKGILHDFEAHEDDWNSGDPSWDGGRGKSLIGLVNYIASRDVNSIYIMMNTVSGDGCDAHPWSSYNDSGDVKSFDVSKMDQWEIVLNHMTENGIMIHAMTQETENDQLLNGGDLGLERKLYYRELISRFAHHPALQWNLGEENTNSTEQRIAYSDYIRSTDPYAHPILMHTYPGQHDEYEGLLGLDTFDGASIQVSGISTDASGSGSGVYGLARQWLDDSGNAGQQWIMTFTEASGNHAPTPYESVTSRQRIYWMWASVMSGGAGFEWYLKNDGSGHAYDLAVENLREFDEHWAQSGYLVRFFRDTLQGDFGIDLQSMNPDNAVTSASNDWVLSDPGNAYLIYLREGGSTELTLPNSNTYRTHWFNPRTGQITIGRTLVGSGSQNIGNPPSDADADWMALVLLESDATVYHPDIVYIANIDASDIVSSPADNWKDSYSVGDRCYCDTTFDHNIGDITVDTPQGDMTVREACNLIGPGPGAAGRPVYNDIQCGNGPANDAGDEDYCPGRVDLGKDGCVQIGPTWNFADVTTEDGYVEQDGVVVMGAENTASDLDLWAFKADLSGYTGSGYIEFAGNTPMNGPAQSPFEYPLTVTQSGLD